MPSIKIISDVALYSSLTAISGITTPSINITESFTSPEITVLGSASGTWDATTTTVRDNSAAWLDGGKDAEVRALTAAWDSTTTSVNTNSANWNESYTSVSTTSSNWNEAYTSTSTNSGNWSEAYTSTSNNSANWNEAYTSTSTNSANWNESYTSVSTTSSNWNEAYTATSTNSANWNESYTWVNSNSSTLDVAKIDIGNSHLANDETVKLSVNGNVVIYGDLSATGNTTLVNVTANVTDSLSVVNLGFGTNALTIEQYGPLPAIHASHYGTGPLLILSGGGNVGIGTDEPNSKLTVVGVISTDTPAGYSSEIINTSDTWYKTSVSLQTNSGNWNQAYTSTSTNSANWNQAYTSTSTNSANWNSTYTTFRDNSGNFLTSYTEQQTLAFDTNTKDLTLNGGASPSTVSLANIGGGSDVSGLSGNWENTYTTVKNTSGKWESSYSTLQSKSGTWETAAAGAGADAAVRSLTGKWENTYSTVNANSANWGGGSAIAGITNVSGNWDSTYTTVKNNSSNWVDQEIYSGPSQVGANSTALVLNINEYGKIIAASEQTITPAAINAANATHNHNISDINNFSTEVVTVISNNSNTANGFLKLDGSNRIPTYLFPGGVDEIIESAGAPTGTGLSGKLYLDTTTGEIYRWSGTQFVQIVASPGSTDAVPEGGANLYFTAQRVIDNAPVKSVNTKTGDVTLVASDVGAAAASHTHTAANITDFSTAADARIQAAKSTTTPSAPGTAAVGTSNYWARADHVHPTDTSILSDPTFNTAVDNRITGKAATMASPASDGAGVVGSALTWARQDHKHASDATKANLAGPTFTGTVTIPTLNVTTGLQGTVFNTAADARVLAASGTSTPLMNGTAAVGTTQKWSPENHVHPSDTTKADLASPTFTGTVKAPTVSATTLYGNLLPAISEKTAYFTLAPEDGGKIIKMSNPAAATITVPLDVFSNGGEGTQIIIARLGVGEVTFAADSGVTLLSVENKVSLNSQKSVASIIYIGNNQWLLAGDLN